MAKPPKPAYLMIADELRSAIHQGELTPGQKVPSLSALASQYKVSPIVTRQALGQLRAEGLLDSRKGSGHYVRQPAPMRQPGGFRYENTTPQRPMFATDAASAGASSATWEHRTKTVPATPAVARRLRLREGDPVVRTDYRYLAEGAPIQLATSYEPLSLIGGTAIEEPESGPIYGVRARMESIGVMVEYVTEDVTSRSPYPYETESLDIPSGVHVLHIERTYWWQEQPVETADIMVPGDRYTLRYRIPLR